jgi:hypothetical protein
MHCRNSPASTTVLFALPLSIVAVVFTILAASSPAATQDLGSQLVGVWKYISNVQTETASGRVIKPFGDKVSGYLIYTKGGRVLWAHFGDNRPKPAMPLTDVDRVKLFSTLSAGSGTYKVEGKTVSVTYDTSWHELWTGTTGQRTFEIVDNRLTVSSQPVKNGEGVETRFVITLERVE